MKRFVTFLLVVSFAVFPGAATLAQSQRLTSCYLLFHKKYPSVKKHKAFASSPLIPGLAEPYGLACAGAGPYSTLKQAVSVALSTCRANAVRMLKDTACHIVKSE
jgi:hypothetical protein